MNNEYKTILEVIQQLSYEIKSLKAEVHMGNKKIRELSNEINSLKIIIDSKAKKYKDDDLLDINEVSELMGVSVSRIYRMSSDGEIPKVKIGNRMLRFRYKDLLEYFKSKDTL